MSSSKRRARPHVTAIIVLSLLAVPAAARTGSVETQSTGEGEFSKIRIDNFGRVNGTYYRGAQPETGDYATLAELGVKEMKRYDFGADFLHREFKQFVLGFRPEVFAKAAAALSTVETR